MNLYTSLQPYKNPYICVVGTFEATLIEKHNHPWLKCHKPHKKSRKDKI